MNRSLIPLAKNLRNNSTDVEKLLWYYLKGSQLAGLKFRRQQAIGSYIVDFICFPKKLIIELDGGQHNENEKDKERDRWLRSQGYIVLRFWNNEVLTNIKGVLEEIVRHV